MKVLFIDTGMGVPHAKAFAEQGHEVFLYTPWEEPYSKFVRFASGIGIPGLTKVKSWANVVDEVDFVVIVDELLSPIGAYLKKHGYKVVSPGAGAELETKRLKSKGILEELGIKVPPYKYIKGADDTIAHIRDLLTQKSESSDTSTAKHFVKINVFRGDIETLNVADETALEGFEHWCRVQFGPGRNRINFLVEGRVEGIETGFDVWFDGKDYVRPAMWGFEICADYVGKWVQETPFEEDLAKLRPYLESVGYTGPLSGEILVGPEGHYWIDLACRMPYPLSYIYPFAIKNYCSALEAIANGKSTSFEVESPYSACVCLTVDRAFDRWVPVGYKGGFDKAKNKVGLFPIFTNEGKEFIVPYSDLIGCTVGLGSEPKVAIDEALATADLLNIWRLSYKDCVGEHLLAEAADLKEKHKIEF